MRGIYTPVTDIRRKVFTEVARMAYEVDDMQDYAYLLKELPYRIIPGEESNMRSSIFLGGAIVYGYKKLAGKYSVTGFLISLVFSTVMSFLAFYTDAAVGLYMEAKDYFTFWDIFANVRPIYEAMGALRHYYVNLALMMLVGIASTAALGSSSLKEQKEEGELERL